MFKHATSAKEAFAFRQQFKRHCQNPLENEIPFAKRQMIAHDETEFNQIYATNMKNNLDQHSAIEFARKNNIHIPKDYEHNPNYFLLTEIKTLHTFNTTVLKPLRKEVRNFTPNFTGWSDLTSEEQLRLIKNYRKYVGTINPSISSSSINPLTTSGTLTVEMINQINRNFATVIKSTISEQNKMFLRAFNEKRFSEKVRPAEAKSKKSSERMDVVKSPETETETESETENVFSDERKTETESAPKADTSPPIEVESVIDENEEKEEIGVEQSKEEKTETQKRTEEQINLLRGILEVLNKEPAKAPAKEEGSGAGVESENVASEEGDSGAAEGSGADSESKNEKSTIERMLEELENIANDIKRNKKRIEMKRKAEKSPELKAMDNDTKNKILNIFSKNNLEVARRNRESLTAFLTHFDPASVSRVTVQNLQKHSEILTSWIENSSLKSMEQLISLLSRVAVAVQTKKKEDNIKSRSTPAGQPMEKILANNIQLNNIQTKLSLMIQDTQKAIETRRNEIKNRIIAVRDVEADNPNDE